jgi:very-short-patch-repair endonuclease
MKRSENSVIIETTRALRRKSTKGESILWQKIRNKKLNGAKFHRQHAIKFIINGYKRFFVADFYCSEHKLVIEIDGKIHERHKDYDEMRSYIMNTMGINVIRFKNEEVENNCGNVLSKIAKELY